MTTGRNGRGRNSPMPTSWAIRGRSSWGRAAAANGVVELKRRATGEREELSLQAALAKIDQTR